MSASERRSTIRTHFAADAAASNVAFAAPPPRRARQCSPMARITFTFLPRRAFATPRANVARARAFSLPAADAAADADADADATPPASPIAFTKIYSGAHIKLFRIAVKFKIAQLATIGSFASPALAFAAGSDASAVANAAALGASASAALCALCVQYYASRYVGELAIGRDRHGREVARVSTMDFWGARVDDVVDFADIVPPLAQCDDARVRAISMLTFIPLEVRGKRTYVVSLRHGRMVDGAAMLRVCRGARANDELKRA